MTCSLSTCLQKNPWQTNFLGMTVQLLIKNIIQAARSQRQPVEQFFIEEWENKNAVSDIIWAFLILISSQFDC